MSAARRLLDAPTITADLLAEILDVRPSLAIAVIVRLMVDGALYRVAPGEFALTPSGRSAAERDAVRAA